MDKCYSLIERQMYSEAFRLLNSILKNEFDQPKLETIFLLQYLLNQTSRYRNIQIKLLELVTPEENEEEKYFNLIFDLICIYIDQMNFQQAELKMNQLKKYLQSIKNNKIFLYYLDGIKNMIQHKQKNIDPKEQYEEYERLLKKEEQSKYFEQDGMPAYLIPSRWIKKWKSYVTNLPIQAENDTIIIEKEVENLRIMLNVSCDIEIEEQINNPGPINGLTLIQVCQSLEVDPLSSKQYQNYVLRENLREGSDFILVGHELFDYFKKIYGGFEIKRLIVEHQQTHQKYVDLAPRLFGFLVIPAETNPFIRHITANASDQIQDIQKKVKRIFNIQNEIRFWKFNDTSASENFVQKFYKQELYKQIAGKVINKTTVLEEINFATNDFFICEIKQGKDWYLSEINQKQVSQLKSKMNVSEVPVMDEDSRKGLTGLQNLGNTCFMNAALQCLSNTYELTEYMVSNEFSQHLNCNNPLGTKGLMATAYAELMKSMWYGSDQSVSAYDLKRVIGKFAPQFYGYGQQDSHEFLSYLLDGLHEDLNKVLTKPLVKDIEITNESDFEASRIFWNNYILRNQSKIQELMVGQYKSTLVCPNCKRISKTFDPYMSLSLPIPSYSFLQFHFYVIYNTGKQADKVSICVTSDQDFKSIINDISKTINLDSEQMNFVLIKDHTIKERITLKKNIKQCAEHEGQLFVFQVDKEYYSLQDNQIHIDFYYCTKSDRMYANESVFTFPRQLVIEKTYKLIEVYFKIYQQFKYHFKNIISRVATKFFHEGTNIEELIQSNPQNLEEYVTEMKNYRELPFQLTYRGKLLQFDSELTIETFYQKTLSINVILNPQISKDEIVGLKFQRCKDVMIEQSRQIKNGEYTLEDCLRTFAKEEILGKGDEWYCNRCKLHVQATKQMEIYRAPKVLVIHLKRFRSANRISNYGNFFYTGGSQKITNLVHFPKSLNLNNYVLSKLNDNDCIDYTYDLYGVDNHYGGLGGGHYTAYAYNSIINKWVDYDDSRARITNQNIESEAAYVLFYRRKDSQKCILGK